MIEFCEVTRDFVRVRNNIVGQEQDVALELREQQTQLFRSTDPVGIKEYAVEWARQSSNDLGGRALVHRD
jgi:hypothetical protein